MCYIEVILFFKFKISNPNKIQFLNNWQFTTKKNHFSVIFSFLNYKVIEDNKKKCKSKRSEFLKIDSWLPKQYSISCKKKKKGKIQTKYSFWKLTVSYQTKKKLLWTHEITFKYANDNSASLFSVDPPLSSVCELPVVPGPCKALESRYYYNSSKRRCETFFYGGCCGNANNFKTLVACTNTCSLTL